MLVSIAGNIGSGKSSVTALLHEHYGWKPLYEPVIGNPYLRDFYADMAAWAYQSQLYFLSRQCNAKEMIPDGKTVAVQDRSIYEDAEIFAAYLFELGFINNRDYNTYTFFYRGLLRVLPVPHAIIYLRAETNALIQNIRSRGRDFERDIPKKYIEDLNDRYEAWARDFKRCSLHIVDTGNFEFLYDTQAQEEIVYTIRQFTQK